MKVDIKVVVFGALLIALALASTAAWIAWEKYQEASTELTDLRRDVKKTNDEAARKLNELTVERDAKQAKLDQQAADQEKKDAVAQIEIDRLAGELRDRPFRVRIVTAPAGSCSGGAGSDQAGAADSGAEDPAATYGLLPPENTRRLNEALTEVETLSAAYSSCRETLIQQP